MNRGRCLQYWERPEYRSDWKKWAPGGRSTFVMPDYINSGLTLRQAMLHYRERYIVDYLLELEDITKSSRTMRSWLSETIDLCKYRTILERNVVDRLSSGALTAKGYSQYDSPDEPARLINPDRWRFMTPNFDESYASAPGTKITGILVFDRPAEAMQSTVQQPRFSPARLERRARSWYKNWVEV